MPELPDIAQALQTFGGDHQRAQGLASVLGFDPVSSPADLLAGGEVPLQGFFDQCTDRFGVR